MKNEAATYAEPQAYCDRGKPMTERKKNAAVERYLRKVRRELPIPGKTKKALLRRIQEAVYEQTRQDGKLDMEELISRFGSPRQIVEGYMDGMSVTEFARDLRIRRRIVRIVSMVAMLVLLLWAGRMGKIWLQHRSYDNGYITERLIVTERTTFPEGEN